MRKSSPIDALFPKTRQKILAATYGQPEKWWFMSELATLIKTTPSSLQRELGSLASSGILRKRRDGNRLYFQAEADSPIFRPLHDLVLQTLGLPAMLKESLAPFAEEIRFAFIYGSVARQEDHALSDVDLIIIGDMGLAAISPMLRELERKSGREINPACFSDVEFRKKLKAKNHLLTSVLKEKKIFLIGDENELERLAHPTNGAKAQHQYARNRKPARTRRP